MNYTATFKRRSSKEGYMIDPTGRYYKPDEGGRILNRQAQSYVSNIAKKRSGIPTNDPIYNTSLQRVNAIAGKNYETRAGFPLKPFTHSGRTTNSTLRKYIDSKRNQINNRKQTIQSKSPKVNRPSGNRTMPNFIPDSIPKINHKPINKSNLKPKISNVTNTKNAKKLGMLGKVGIGAGIAGLGIGGIYLGNKLMNRKKKNRFGL